MRCLALTCPSVKRSIRQTSAVLPIHSIHLLVEDGSPRGKYGRVLWQILELRLLTVPKFRVPFGDDAGTPLFTPTPAATGSIGRPICKNSMCKGNGEMKKVLVISLFLFLVGLPAKAQTYLGAINGTVTDPSGAVVPGASVKITKKSTGIEHATVSTSDGGFVFQALPVGAYSVVVTAAGFPVTTIEGVLVEQGAVYTLPVSLKISQAATSVEVSAAALSLATTSETQTTLVGGADLQQMPLNGRDFTQLISVAPGFAGYSAR